MTAIYALCQGRQVLGWDTNEPHVRQPSESSKRRVSFKLLRRVSHTLSKSHPTIRENIILHGLSLLKKQFPLALNDLNARSIYCNLLELCR